MPLISLTAAQHSPFFSTLFFFCFFTPIHPPVPDTSHIWSRKYRVVGSGMQRDEQQMAIYIKFIFCFMFRLLRPRPGGGGWRMVHVSSGGCTHAWLGRTYVGESADPLSQHPHMEQQEVRLKFMELRCRGRRAGCRSLMQRGNWTKWTSDSEPEGLSDLFSHT